MEDRHIVAIDLGSSKIALSVAKIHGDDVQIIYYKEAPSEGVRNSYVYNAMKITGPLKKLMEDAQNELNIKITQAVIGMPKYRVRQEMGSARFERNEDECITEEEINDLKTASLEDYPIKDLQNERLFGAVVQSFSNGEDFQLVENEIIGMPSAVLEGNFKIFIGSSRALHNIDVAFNQLGIGVARMYFTPDPVAKAVLTQSEMENGVALIDFGGGATSVSIYYGSIMRHYASIPFGGNAVTSDIKSECMISNSLAENIKLAYGACMPEKLQNLSEKIIQINSGSAAPNKQLPVKYLSEIITHRVYEIMEAVLYEIERSGFADNLRNGIVLTGGSANLTNCGNYIKEISGYNVRQGYPRHLFSATGCEGLYETSAAVSIGLILTAKGDHVSDCIVGDEMLRPGANVTFGTDGDTASGTDTYKAENAADQEDTRPEGELFAPEEIETVDKEELKRQEKERKRQEKEEREKEKKNKPKRTPIWTTFETKVGEWFNQISNEKP